MRYISARTPAERSDYLFTVWRLRDRVGNDQSTLIPGASLHVSIFWTYLGASFGRAGLIGAWITVSLWATVLSIAMALSSCSSSPEHAQGNSDENSRSRTQSTVYRPPPGEALSSKPVLPCPQYPEVWQRVPTTRVDAVSSAFWGLVIRSAAPCEVWFGERVTYPGEKYQFYAHEFFSGREVGEPDSFDLAAVGRAAQILLSQGSDRITLANGTKASFIDLPYWDCPSGGRGFLSAGLPISVNVLRWLDHPVPEQGVNCGDGYGEDFKRQVQIVANAQLLPLSDGTFLMMDWKSGLILRLTADLKTRAPIVGTKVLLVDEARVTRAIESLELDDRPALFAELEGWFVGRTKED